ncbi:MAG TPA: hypothetical protein VEF35_04185 [Candidatus Bathyarchaeia archaeon]|nr:hypothetical protein [Candidatus Bathyarchaeia archaeon]
MVSQGSGKRNILAILVRAFSQKKKPGSAKLQIVTYMAGHVNRMLLHKISERDLMREWLHLFQDGSAASHNTTILG